MPRKLVLMALAVLVCPAATERLGATTLVLGSDAGLADGAEAIVVATVLDSAAVPHRPAVDHRLDVERTLKGRVPSGEALLRVPGGAAGSLTLRVPGAPRLLPGERVLLFMGEDGDGQWAPYALAAGVFHREGSGARAVAGRDLSELHVLGAGAAEQLRHFDRFVGWLADRAAGVHRPADYLLPASAAPFAKFNPIRPGLNVRWPVFDSNKDVQWRIHQNGQPGLAGGGVAELQRALQVWNDDPATNIRYKYAGTTGNGNGFNTFDALNTLIFDDPWRTVPGTVTCGPGESAILAVGGPWFDSAGKVAAADIVVNDGAGCFFGNDSKAAEEVYAHELGHTLGLGHACGDTASGPCNTPAKADALMTALVHDDGRGARLGDDDRAGILALYRPALGAPGNLVASPIDSTQVRLDWVDNATAEVKQYVEMKKGKAGAFAPVALELVMPDPLDDKARPAKFQQVGTANKDVTTFVVTKLAARTEYSFRVRAKGAKGYSDYSNIVTITTP